MLMLAVAKQNPRTQLLGTNERGYVEIIRWMSFVNSEVQPHLANWFKPLIGRRPYNAENVRIAGERVNRAVAVLESHLQSTYLLGESLTLADLFAASSVSRGFQYVFDSHWQQSYPRVTNWFMQVTGLPMWRRIVPEPVIVSVAVKYHSDVN